MNGYVVELHAILPVIFLVPNQPPIQIECVIDTGFTGALALPSKAVDAMQLPFLEEMLASLANDTEISLSVHVATIVWNGIETRVRVLATGRHPLIGTSLLSNSHLGVDFLEQGSVVIESL